MAGDGPDEAVTLLLTDIEGSTRHWEVGPPGLPDDSGLGAPVGRLGARIAPSG